MPDPRRVRQGEQQQDAQRPCQRRQDELLGLEERDDQHGPQVVGVSSLGDSAVVISVMPWVSVPDFFVAQTDVKEAIIEQFAQKKISIPFPQQEVRIIGKGA